ncbi:MAG: hypothetical protein ACREPH_09755 [Rhodanobacteraceae bacterium]
MSCIIRLLKKRLPALFQRDESGACLFSASPNQALDALDLRRTFHGSRQQGVFQHRAIWGLA